MSSIDKYLLDNRPLSEYRGTDLKQLLNDINCYLIEYRDSLSLGKKITFGTEIEYDGIDKKIVDNYVKKNHLKWESKRDASVEGGEITSPILHDTKDDWLALKNVCMFLKNHGATSSDKTGGHIHFGTNIFDGKRNNLFNVLELYCVYENILFRFGYGQDISGRTNLGKYAAKLSPKIITKLAGCVEEKDSNIYVSTEKYSALNLGHMSLNSNSIVDNTIEFRLANGSVEETIWQNNINTFGNLLLTGVNCDFDKEKIDKKVLELYHNPYPDFMYNEICLQQVLEFVDIIFDNNLDKINFLRQYIKGYEDNYGITGAKRAKTFIR